MTFLLASRRTPNSTRSAPSTRRPRWRRHPNSEKRWRAGAPLGAADGLPATIKDNIWLKGHPTGRGSKTGDHSPAQADAPACARLREQGAVFVGKTTLPEYGWIGVCHSPLTGITRNPWNAEAYARRFDRRRRGRGSA